jgi:hypothetical protein
MRKTLPVALGSGVLLLAIAAIALADTGKITDPSGDVKYNPPGNPADWDFTKATWGHARHGKLVHTVSVKGNVGNPRASGRTGPLPDMSIKIPGKKGPNPTCNYFVQPPTPPSTSWAMYTCSNGMPRRTGSVTVIRTNRHTLKFVFNQGAIGSPSEYRWNFFFPSEKCDQCAYDSIPDKRGKLHKLR